MRVLLVASKSSSWPYIPELIDHLRRAGDQVELFDLDSQKLLYSNLLRTTVVRVMVRLLILKNDIPCIRQGLDKKPLFKQLLLRSVIGVVLGLSLFKRVAMGSWRHLFYPLIHYNAVNFHSVQPSHLFAFFPWVSPKQIITIWGSEFLRASDEERESFREFYRQATCITFNNEVVRQSFVKFYGDFEEKTKILRFGIGSFDIILAEIERTSVAKIKSDLGIEPEERTICVGYNASEAQRHIEAIRELAKLPAQAKARFLVLLPMTYGESSPDYTNQVVQLLEANGIKYKMFRQFMSIEENARLRIASDIVINIQATDSFSASVQEHLLVGCKLIVGSWLPYNSLASLDSSIESIDSTSQLNDRLQKFLNLSNMELSVRKVNTELYNLSSWESNLPNWQTAYQ